MRTLMGVWVSQTKAVVVRLDDQGATTVTLLSDIVPKNRATGGTASSRPYMHCSVSSRDRLDHARDAAVLRFFEDIVKAVEKADEIAVVGPGEAKKMLSSKLVAAGLNVTAVETAGSRLTEPQISARIQKMFGRPAPRMPRQVPGLAVPTR